MKPNKQNKWKPRAEQAGPKTLEELHKEFKEEQASKEVLQSVALNQQSDKRFITSSRAQTATPSKTSDRSRETRNPVHVSNEGTSILVI